MAENRSALVDYSLAFALHEVYAPRMRKAYQRAVRYDREINVFYLRRTITDLFRATVHLLSHGNDDARTDFLLDDDVSRLVNDYVGILGTVEVMSAVARILPPSLSATERTKRMTAVRYLDEHSAFRVERYRQKLLQDGMPERTVERRVKQFRNELVQRRGNLIATTETSRVINSGVLALALHNQDHDPAVEWVARRDNRVERECVHLDGERAYPGDIFVTLHGRTVPHPPVHPRCRCFLAIVWK